MIKTLAFIVLTLFSATSFAEEKCWVSVAVDLEKTSQLSLKDLSSVKKKVNSLIETYKKGICLYFVGTNAFERMIIKMNFDIEKTNVSFIDDQKSKD
jgi:hypothetical protein